MTDTNELQAAVDRLRRVKAGEAPVDVYDTAGTVAHLGSHGLAMRRLWRDQGAVADAYLELGERQPDERRVYAAGVLWDADEVFDVICHHHRDAKLVRLVSFIQEIPEVPNAD